MPKLSEKSQAVLNQFADISVLKNTDPNELFATADFTHKDITYRVRGKMNLATFEGKFIAQNNYMRNIFKTMRLTAEAFARKASPNLDQTLTFQGVTLTMKNMGQTVYTINYLDAVVKQFSKIEAELQPLVQAMIGTVLGEFVYELARPQARDIIDTLVYKPGFQRSADRLSSIADRFNRTKPTKDKAQGRLRNRWGLITEVSGQSTVLSREKGTDPIETPTGSIPTVGGLFGKASHMFGKHYAPTGRLRDAFIEGINVHSGSAITVGVDESMFPGKPYWSYVEFGHGYKVNGKWLPVIEEEKPFLRQMNAWMQTQGRAELNRRVQEAFSDFESVLYAGLDELLTPSSFGGTALQGDAISQYGGNKMGTLNRAELEQKLQQKMQDIDEDVTLGTVLSTDVKSLGFGEKATLPSTGTDQRILQGHNPENYLSVKDTD